MVDGTYTAEELEKVQHIELEMLEEFIRICEKHDIPYVALDGTVLGAVRHDGFIPWDDDIDVGLLRKDYERFLKVAPQELDEGCFLQTFGTDPGYCNYYAKIRRNGTTFATELDAELKMHRGLFIDIFPLDHLYDDPCRRKKQMREIRMAYQMYIAKEIHKTEQTDGKLKSVLKQLIRSAFSFLSLFCRKERLYKRLDDVRNACNDRETQYVLDDMIPVPVRSLFPTVPHDFAGRSIRIPAEYDAYLTEVYGNYRELPPEEKRVGHRPVRLSFTVELK